MAENPLLCECQEQVATCDPNLYYPEAYRDAETWYWSDVPQWMQEWKDAGGMVVRALDVGCAYGTLALYCRKLWDCEVYCTDRVPGRLRKVLADKHGLTFALNDIEREPFPWPDLRFDAIVFTEVLEHLNCHPVPTLVKLRGLLAPGGKVFLSTPNGEGWPRIYKHFGSIAEMPPPTPDAVHLDAEHVWHYTEEELRAVLAESGFVVERYSTTAGYGVEKFTQQCQLRVA